MINKIPQTLYVVQSESEEKGLFKIFGYESSVFHWNDASKPHNICIKIEEYEFSGDIKIDDIGELNVRLRSSIDRD